MKKLSKPRPNVAHILLEKHLAELGLTFAAEVKFHPTRNWRLDYLLTNVSTPASGLRIAIEIDGGIYTQGRHTRGKGYENDCRKLNAANALGYHTLRFTTNQVFRGEARSFLKEFICK